MNRRSPPPRSVVALLAIGSLLAACAAACGGGHGEEGCPEYCEQLLACPSIDTTEEKCLSACEANQETAETKGCGDEYGNLLECYGHAEDLCDTALVDDECTVQKQAFDACVGSG